jgi:1-acyl-sn-glycerol-3-phosphate acyltransferase
MGFNLPFSVMRLYSTLWMRSRARVVVKGADELPPRKKGEKRVYILMNHSTTFDIVALMHLSREPFAILMDGGAFKFPIIGHILRAAGFVPLDKSNSQASVQECVDKVNKGVPLLISLHEGNSTLGDWGRPRTGGIRIAHLTGATVCPIFLKVEEEHIRHLSFKGTNGVEYPYTTFKNTFYFVEFLKPLDLSSLPADAKYEDYFEVAKDLNEKLEAVEARYDTFLADNRERFAPLRRRGGARFKVAW